MLFTRDTGGDTKVCRLAKWILEKNEELDSLEDTTDILENRLVDSLDLTSFILFVEELRGQPIPAGEVVPEDFRSLQVIQRTFLQQA